MFIFDVSLGIIVQNVDKENVRMLVAVFMDLLDITRYSWLCTRHL